jgi:transposase
VYLRRSDRTKDGKTHTYWRLVRSVRRGGKVVQETVAQLGELDSKGRARARALARAIAGGYAQGSLFEETAGAETVVPVRLNRIRLERGRVFGNVWLGWTLWGALGLDRLCAELMPEGREAVAWSWMAATLVIGRLCEPSSELYLAERWYPRTALEDLLGLPTEKVNDDRLYRALDRLLPHKATIEKHLVRRLGELFEVDYDLLLYDVTSTYFEGLAQGNDLARRGHSRDHRHDCKQVCIALVVTREGMPVGYELFAGNRTDVTTVEEIVETMESRYGLARRIWVMDRGMTSAENIAWLRRTGRCYLIGTPKSDLRKWSREIVDSRDWQQVRDGVEAKLCPGPDGEEMFLLCRSAQRREKERAIHDRFVQRLEVALRSLADRIERSRCRLDRHAIHEQIGRLRERYSRAAGRYDIRLLEEPSATSGLRLIWSPRPSWDAWARHSEGCYVLRTNVTDWQAEDLWRTYIQLSEAEAAFRVQKSDLSIRPVWHQTAHRVRAHILVCFLAYALWKALEQWQTRAGLGNSPRVLLDELATIHSTDCRPAARG